MGLYTKDTAGHLEETDPVGNNVGLRQRNAFTQKSKVAELIGRLHTDICNQGRLILNGLPIRLVFHRSKDAFAIMASGNAHSTKLSEAVLC